MNYSRHLFLIAVGALTASAGAQTITNIGALHPTSSSSALAISGDGTAVAGYATLPGGYYRAIRWSASDGLQNLGLLPGGLRTFGYSISGDGAAVAGVCIISGGAHAIRWTSGGLEDLGTLPGQVAFGFAISGDGNVVGGGPSTGGMGNAFKWTAGDGMSDLGVVDGGTFAALYSLSGDGSSGAGMARTADGDRAILWTGTGGMEVLGVLEGGATSEADAISADGTVVVGISDSALGTRAFHWTKSGPGAGVMHDMGTALGRSTSGATSMNRDGSVIGGFDEAGAILWTASTGWVDLRQYLLAQGVNMTGWTLSACNGVSADGSALAGDGRYNGLSRGWIVRGLTSTCTPRITVQPEPVTVCASGVGTFTVSGAAESGVIGYRWQMNDPATRDAWRDLDDGPLTINGGACGMVSGAMEGTLRVELACIPSQPLAFRGVVSGGCGSVISHEATLTMCAADWNCTDGLDSQDYFDFLEEFFEGDADFNHMDGTDSQDYFDFLDAFFTGCA